MKGQAEVTEVLTIIGIAVVLLITIPLLIPLIRKYIEYYASSSPQVVSRDVATLLSTVVSSPYNISVLYEVEGDRVVDVDIHDRKVFVVSGESEANSPILIDATGSFDDVNQFKIEKRLVGGETKLLINDKVIFREVS